MKTKLWIGMTVGAGLLGCGPIGLSHEGAPMGPAQPGPEDSYQPPDGGGNSTGSIEDFGEGDGDIFDPGMGTAPWPARLPSAPVRSSKAVALSGGTLAVSPDGIYALTSDPDRDLIQVLRLSDRKLVSLQIEAGSEPGRATFDKAGFAHVVLRNAGALARIELANATSMTSTKVCALPRGVTYVEADDSLAVACASGELVRLRASDHGEISRQFIDTDLRDVVVGAAGKLFVSRYRSAELLEIGVDGKVARRQKPAGVGAFRQLDGAPVTFEAALNWRAAPASNGKVMLLHQRAQHEEVFTDSGGYGGVGSCSSISHPGISLVGPDGEPELSFSLDGIALAVDAAISPDQQWIAVAGPSGYLNFGSTLQIYQANDVALSMPLDLATLPGVPADNCQFPVYTAGTECQVTAVIFTNGGLLITQCREPAQIDIYAVAVTPASEDGGIPPFPTFEHRHTISLSDESVADSGHDMFHADVGGGITCASCHGEGADDGRVWNFSGVGPRRTQNMRGGIKGTAPFHWDGDMTSFQHLVDTVLTGRMGGFAVPANFGDALITWIDEQPALRLPATSDAAATRGQTLFESEDTGCATCHVGNASTNNLTVDVGTGGAFQVPSLTGLGLRAPYMHSGCATTLEERFNANCGGDKHGDVSKLTAEELADLVTYLKTL